MKKRVITSLLNSIKEQLGVDGQNLQIRGVTAIQLPHNDLYRGIAINAPQTPREDFYIHIFVVPLYLPTEVLYYNIGWRLGGRSTTWAANTLHDVIDHIKMEAIPWLESVSTPQGFLAAVPKLGKGQDLYVLQAMIAVSAVAGEREQLSSALGNLERLACGGFAWQIELLERGRLIQKLFLQDQDALQKVLGEWRASTCQKLGIPVSVY